MPNSICVIPARGGSRRIPMKNIKEFHGKPIIAYSIELAQELGVFSRIVVSTDNDDIAAVATQYGAETYRRPFEYGRDNVGTQEVVAECLSGIGADGSELVCCLYATAPLLDMEDLVKALEVYAYDDRAVFVFAVGLDPLHDAGQFYLGAGFDFLHGVNLIEPHSRMIPIPAERDCDINTMDDWNRALAMYEELHK